MLKEFNPAQCEQEIKHYINLARKNPPKFTKLVENRLNSYKGKIFSQSGKFYESIEGRQAPDECIACLDLSFPKSELKLAPDLCKAARELAEYNGRSGSIKHTLDDRKSIREKLNSTGQLVGKCGQIISVLAENGLDFVLGWMIDDGVSLRPDRKMILNRKFTKFGVGCAEHQMYGTIAVVVFAEEYKAQVGENEAIGRIHQTNGEDSGDGVEERPEVKITTFRIGCRKEASNGVKFFKESELTIEV